MKARVLIALNHPAHYYVFKYTALALSAEGYEVKYVIREKDVLEKLLISEGVNYTKVCRKSNRKSNVFSVLTKGALEILKQDVNLFRFVLKWKPDLMIGTDFAITHVGSLLQIPSFVFNEDDYDINKLFCNLSYPFATKIIAPNSCSVGKYTFKKSGYNGIQKMAYLQLEYFTPNKKEIAGLLQGVDRYFVIRLVNLTAGHDIEGKHTGLTENLIDQIITLLCLKGRVFINSERKLNPKYEPYRLSISPNKMHHLLAHASLFIGDSQTMCAEAGLLGTPFIRFNDFVDKIEYLNEIENTYRLGYGIPTAYPEKVTERIQEIIQLNDVKEIWRQRKDRIFREKINPTVFYTRLITDFLDRRLAAK